MQITKYEGKENYYFEFTNDQDRYVVDIPMNDKEEVVTLYYRFHTQNGGERYGTVEFNVGSYDKQSHLKIGVPPAEFYKLKICNDIKELLLMSDEEQLRYLDQLFNFRNER